jgi:hypothetical protein
MILALFATVAHASLLISATVDKDSLSTNEVGLLTIKIFNDADMNAKNVILTIKGDEQIKFFEDAVEKSSIYKTIDSIGAGQGIEAKIKIKSISSKNPSANIYVYYGFEVNPKNAAVTVVQTVDLPQTITSTMEKKSVNGKDLIVTTFKLINNSSYPITKVSAEVIAPTGFEENTQPFFSETISAGQTINQTFNIAAPLEARGEQKFILAYGYFDANVPHYFEKSYSMNFQKADYGFLILIGVIVLIIGVYTYMKKDTKPAVKGTAEKK